jgi:hypothetical protein
MPYSVPTKGKWPMYWPTSEFQVLSVPPQKQEFLFGYRWLAIYKSGLPKSAPS